jgi:hypothetical protein
LSSCVFVYVGGTGVCSVVVAHVAEASTGRDAVLVAPSGARVFSAKNHFVLSVAHKCSPAAALP